MAVAWPLLLQLGNCESSSPSSPALGQPQQTAATRWRSANENGEVNLAVLRIVWTELFRFGAKSSRRVALRLPSQLSVRQEATNAFQASVHLTL